MAGTRPRLAYVAYNFPVLTQTFTLHEIQGLRERGVALDVFASRCDADADRDPEARAERATTTYLRGASSPGVWLAALAFLVRRPCRWIATFAACLGGRYRDDALRCRMRAPLHFLRGIDLASRLRRAGGFGRVHAQFVDAGSTVAFVAARLLDLPFSFTNHTAYNPYQLDVKARHADLLVSISDFDRGLLMESSVPSWGAAATEKVVVNRVGIRVEDWCDGARRAEEGRVLIVGGLREKKGQDVLVRAAHLLAERGCAVRLRIAGGGDDRTLRALADELGVTAEFLGPVPPATVREELASAAVFALPCRIAANGDLDGIPVALMEAMAAGVPVVSTRLSGIPELVEDGVSGLLAEPGDPVSLADALERVLADGELAERLAAAGRAAVAERHDLRVTTARLATLLVGAST